MCHLTPSQRTSSSSPLPTDLSFIPPNPICHTAYTFASTHLHPSILAHSIRVFLYAQHIANFPLPDRFATTHPWHARSAEQKTTLLFLASLFHDIGTAAEFDGDERFEVCGADAAVEFMREHVKDLDLDVGMGLGATAPEEVWTAIACHTSPGIAEGVAPLARIVREAVLTDFNRPGMKERFGVEGMGVEMERVYPRGEIERVLGDMVVAQVMGKSEGTERDRKAPGQSWPGRLWMGALEMRREGREGVNIYF